MFIISSSLWLCLFFILFWGYYCVQFSLLCWHELSCLLSLFIQTSDLLEKVDYSCFGLIFGTNIPMDHLLCLCHLQRGKGWGVLLGFAFRLVSKSRGVQNKLLRGVVYAVCGVYVCVQCVSGMCVWCGVQCVVCVVCGVHVWCVCCPSWD